MVSGNIFSCAIILEIIVNDKTIDKSPLLNKTLKDIKMWFKFNNYFKTYQLTYKDAQNFKRVSKYEKIVKIKSDPNSELFL